MARRAKDGATQSATNGEINEEDRRALFFNYKGRYAAAKLALKNIEEAAKTSLGKQAIRDIRISLQLDTPEGEDRLKERIEAQLRVARWMGLPIGAQSEMFPEDDRPAAERWLDQGERDGLEGKPRKPDCDPSTPEYESYMNGYAKGNEALARAGITTSKPSKHLETVAS